VDGDPRVIAAVLQVFTQYPLSTCGQGRFDYQGIPEREHLAFASLGRPHDHFRVDLQRGEGGELPDDFDRVARGKRDSKLPGHGDVELLENLGAEQEAPSCGVGFEELLRLALLIRCRLVEEVDQESPLVKLVASPAPALAGRVGGP
jgi:hypothetical protein